MLATPAAAWDSKTYPYEKTWKVILLGRVILAVLFLAVLAAICCVVTIVTRALLKRHRQRVLARVAPELLRYEDIDPKVARVLVAQRNQIETGANIVSQMLNDPVLLIPSEYVNPLELWLESIRKES